MNARFSSVGFFSSVLLGAACASGGATSTSEARSQPGPASAENENVIPRRSCSSSNTSPAPSDGLLADFSTKQGHIETFRPPGSPTTTTLSHSVDNGRLTLTAHAVPATKPQFLTTDMELDGCVDASGFAGAQFDVSGSLSGCSLVYASVDPEHQYYRPDGPYPPQTPIRAEDLTSEARTIKAPFAGSAIQGRPATPTDPARLAFIQWLVIVPVGSSDGSAVPPCAGTIVIDNVKLYH